MDNLFSFVVGITTITILVLSYYWSQTYFSKFKKARDKQIKEDVAEFGQCCGLESGVCTFQPRLDKLNKIQLDAAKKQPDKK
jgi:hypothetical protein